MRLSLLKCQNHQTIFKCILETLHYIYYENNENRESTAKMHQRFIAQLNEAVVEETRILKKLIAWNS